jgi:hypothetical protein
VRDCQGTFRLFCIRTEIIQINACNNSSLVDVQLLANNLHAFFSFFRHRIEPPTPAHADGSRRERPPPTGAGLTGAADMTPAQTAQRLFDSLKPLKERRTELERIMAKGVGTVAMMDEWEAVDQEIYRLDAEIDALIAQ